MNVYIFGPLRVICILNHSCSSRQFEAASWIRSKLRLCWGRHIIFINNVYCCCLLIVYYMLFFWLQTTRAICLSYCFWRCFVQLHTVYSVCLYRLISLFFSRPVAIMVQCSVCNVCIVAKRWVLPKNSEEANRKWPTGIELSRDRWCTVTWKVKFMTPIHLEPCRKQLEMPFRNIR